MENERSSIYVSPCRVCMACVCIKWKVQCSLVPEKYSGHETRLLKGAWHVNGWCIDFGWKVHGLF